MFARTMRPNLHTVKVHADILCVSCRSCGHRNALTTAMLLNRRGITDMTSIVDLRLKCAKCGATDVQTSIPFTVAEALDFVTGRAEKPPGRYQRNGG